MINDKEMEEILDEMKKEKKEGKNDINSVNNADFVKLKVWSQVTTDPETDPVHCFSTLLITSYDTSF